MNKLKSSFSIALNKHFQSTKLIDEKNNNNNNKQNSHAFKVSNIFSESVYYYYFFSMFSIFFYYLSKSSPQVIYQHILTSLNRVSYLPNICQTLCDSNRGIGSVFRTTAGRPAILKEELPAPWETLTKQVSATPCCARWVGPSW